MWEGTPFYCPVLLVAATNRDLNQIAKDGLFRRDLLARFTDRHRIPSLKKRRDELPFILHCLLQRESINPRGIIKGIGQGAFDHVMRQGFDEGNFRELEELRQGTGARAAVVDAGRLEFLDQVGIFDAHGAEQEGFRFGHRPRQARRHDA